MLWPLGCVSPGLGDKTTYPYASFPVVFILSRFSFFSFFPSSPKASLLPICPHLFSPFFLLRTDLENEISGYFGVVINSCPSPFRSWPAASCLFLSGFFLMDLHNSPIPGLTPLSLGPGGPLACLRGLLGDAALRLFWVEARGRYSTMCGLRAVGRGAFSKGRLYFIIILLIM